MKLYEINAITLNYYTGFVNGHTTIARTINKDKIKEIIENFRKEAKKQEHWQYLYKTDKRGTIKVEVKEYDVIE